MKKNLLLCGPIGCGKSTMIRNALGCHAVNAGGYITLRVTENNVLKGFDLAPASALCSTAALEEAQRFLDFGKQPPRNPEVFSCFGRSLLLQARKASFAVADEFGGMELLIAPFRNALCELLSSDVPCIGVLKNRTASEELSRRIQLGADYQKAYREFCAGLYADPNTEILVTAGRYDIHAEALVSQWVQTYVGK